MNMGSQSTTKNKDADKCSHPIVERNEIFYGLSYGEWVMSWSNWLLSENPDYQEGADVLFLRGNIDYKSDQYGARFKEPGKFFNKMRDNGEVIFKDTAVFIPIVTAMYSKNERYEGRVLEDEVSYRYAGRKDIRQGGRMWLAIKALNDDGEPLKGKKFEKVVPDLGEFYFESPKFLLSVDRDSRLKEKFEYPLRPGEYEAVQVGYFVMLRCLPVGRWRLAFGGKGRGEYYTNAVYDIRVLDENGPSRSKDVSGTDRMEIPEEAEDDFGQRSVI